MGRRAPLLLLLAAGCDGGSEGALDVQLEPEGTITDGLAAGSAEEDVVDGWSVSFDRYVVSVGNVRLGRTSGGAERSYPAVHVVDLAALSSTGYSLVDEPSIPAGRWDLVGYQLVPPTASTARDPNVSPTDFDRMVAGGCTYLMKGTLSNPQGQSCPPGGSCVAATSVDFDLCIPAPVAFDHCGAETSTLSGLVVRADARTVVAFTLHGDHLFFDSFPAGAEIVSRRAQWLADADGNGDGLVERAELEAIDTPAELSALFPAAQYDLAGGPSFVPIVSAWDFVVAQVSTQGHFQGEGECAFDALP